MNSLLSLILGRRLANREVQRRKIGAFAGVPAMGLDAIGSSSYGPEAALTILAPLGAASLGYILPITAAILVLLAILYVSYRQTIHAYPSSGGAYTVAKENLGTQASLLAAAALMVDYILNVAVAICAGIAALVSAFPALAPHTLMLCLATLTIITLANLRGTGEAGRMWALPTYTFVASFAVVIGMGVAKAIASGGHPAPIAPPPPLADSAAAAGLWLALRSFSAGCTAMTGVEAVSNGISAFREPSTRYARRTLLSIVLILGVLLAGIAYLVQAYGIGAMDQTQDGYQSVLSQLAAAVAGRGVLYYIAIGSLLCVLVLSANTSFVDFPRLCQMVARDSFLPRAFAVAGRRLVYDVGILYLASTAALLLIAFDGITDRLIPMFAIGAFLTFTLSQTGMVVHWHREQRKTEHVDSHVAARLAVNAVGATTTGVALAVILTTKFIEGAWITVLVIPAVIFLLRKIRQYYDEVGARTRKVEPLAITHVDPPIVIVPTENWSRLTDRALAFALQISPDVIGVHLTSLNGPDDDSEKETHLREQWRIDVEEPVRAAGITPPRLVVLPSHYRNIHGPLLKFISEVEEKQPDRQIAVVIPELVKLTWWQHLLHTHRARRLRAALLRYGGSRLVVMNIPWYLEEPRPAEALEPEAAPPAHRPHVIRARAR
jgi:amino acid transporter